MKRVGRLPTLTDHIYSYTVAFGRLPTSSAVVLLHSLHLCLVKLFKFTEL